MRSLVLAGSAVLFVGCATKFDAPPTLVEARAAYARIAAGPAGTQNRPLLQDAKNSLDSAEAALGTTWEYVVVDNAYLAIRKAELAEARAQLAEVVRGLNLAQQQLNDLEHPPK